MSAPVRFDPEPFFLESDGRRLFALHLHPRSTPLGAVLYLHPFAEEMHKSRRMAALQARALAQAGYAVLQIDLTGCGDSEDDHGDARWERWLEDARTGHDWLRQRWSLPVHLWGLRTGALLAADLAPRLPEAPAGLLLWQPVASGNAFLTQFLRIRLGAEMLAGGKAQTGVDALRAQLAAGDALEIGGYALAPEMAAALDGLQLQSLIPPCPVHWFEVAAAPDRPLSPAARRIVESWQTAGVRVTPRTVQGDSFWITQEITECPALIPATLDALPGATPAAAGPPPPAAAPPGARRPLVSPCDEDRLLGLLNLSESRSDVGVVIVVGGPQYRAGSHGQFTLLARALARRGVPSLRFDYRGMGDSEGAPRNFETVSEDLRAAVDALLQHAPGVGRVALWGLCDAASAALINAHRDPRVTDLILLNPWVHTERAAAQAQVRHYYLARLASPEFWRKLFSGRFNPARAAGDLIRSLGLLLRRERRSPSAREETRHYIERMESGFAAFQGRALCVLSGSDLTAQEYEALSAGAWRGLCARPTYRTHRIQAANHTFASRAWRDEVADETVRWLLEPN